MSNRDCAAGGEHTIQHYETTLFGVFDACSKCGMRPNERCPRTPGGHGDHNYQPHKKTTQRGIVNAGKCSYCGKVVD